MPTLPPPILCQVIKVHDGDTLTCAGQSIRLWGVDAPELDGSPRCHTVKAWACDPTTRRWSIDARDRLIALAKDGLTCVPMDQDRYRRLVARCDAGFRDVGSILVREGLARDFTRFSKGAYLADEIRARRELRGMWGG